jgi:hypothetical protein
MESLYIVKLFIFGSVMVWLFYSDPDNKKKKEKTETKTISSDFGWVLEIPGMIWMLILFLVVVVCVVGGIASFFAMLASIIHFQILGAMGYLVLLILCYGIGSWTTMYLKYR